MELVFLSSIWFWIVFSVLGFVSLVSLSYSDDEFPVVPGICFLGFGIFMKLFFGVELSLMDHISQVLILLSSYIVSGCIWSIFRWYLLCLDALEKTKLKKEEMLATNGEISEYGKERLQLMKPIASQNKGRIIGWITYWPLSLIHFACFDFVKRLVTGLYNKLKNFMQSISDKMFKGVLED